MKLKSVVGVVTPIGRAINRAQNYEKKAKKIPKKALSIYLYPKSYRLLSLTVNRELTKMHNEKSFVK